MRRIYWYKWRFWELKINPIHKGECEDCFFDADYECSFKDNRLFKICRCTGDGIYKQISYSKALYRLIFKRGK